MIAAKQPTQLLLGLRPAPLPRFDNFVGGNNEEVLTHVRALLAPRAVGAVFLWGPAGSGKSHLLSAAAQAVASSAGALRRPLLRLGNMQDAENLQVAPDTLIMVDDVSALDGVRQTLLFRLFNSAHLAGLAFLLADRTPPVELAMRDDLRTRLGQALIFHLAPLTDLERADALRRHALMRGMRLDDTLIQYLLRHARRDLPALMQILDELDRASLELKRQPTLPLLRELMQNPIDLD